MIRLHIAIANARYRLHRLAGRLYDWTHEPADDGHTLRPLIDHVAQLREVGAHWRAGRLVDAQGRFLPHDIEAWRMGGEA